MSKYTIIDIDLNIDVEQIMSEGALKITEKASKMLQEIISDTKALEGATESKKRQEKDEPNDYLYELFKTNNNILSKETLAQLVPDKFKSFSTMIMRFGNYLRKKDSYEYLKKEESKNGIKYILDKIPEVNDNVKSQDIP